MHRLLEKQIEEARDADGQVDQDRLIALVAKAYEAADAERERTDQAISAMVGELDEMHAGLEAEIDRRTGELRESRRTLKLQNTRFTAALENMSHGISMYDKHQRLVTCNKQFLDIYQLPKKFGRIGTTFRAILYKGGVRAEGVATGEVRLVTVDTGEHHSIDNFGGSFTIDSPGWNVEGVFQADRCYYLDLTCFDQ